MPPQCYGAYGRILEAEFDGTRLALVNRGVIDVVAHVRGGSEKGQEWYQQARFAGNPKTFQDFIDVAKYLCTEGFNSPGKIVASGGSAGGLLMGAVANMAPPKVFAGIIATVPLVDALAIWMILLLFHSRKETNWETLLRPRTPTV